MPIYNMEKYLDRCLRSIVAQTYGFIDIILVDDGSTDKSATICHKYTKEDNRITYIKQDNAGLGAARNAGIRAAKSDYITFLDADDWLEPTFIEKILRSMLDYGSEVGLCDIFYVDSGTYTKNAVKIRFDKHVVSCKEDRSVINKSRLFAWGKIFDMELINRLGFMFPQIAYEDIIIPILMAGANRISYVPEPLINYLRNRPSSLSNNSKYIGDIGTGLVLLHGEFNKQGLYAEYAIEFKKIALGQLRFAARKWGSNEVQALEESIFSLIPEFSGFSQKKFYVDGEGIVKSALDKALPYEHQQVSDAALADGILSLTENELELFQANSDDETRAYNIAELIMEKIIVGDLTHVC